MDHRTDWIVRNGTLAVALYFGIVEQVSWLAYGIAAYAWWTLAAIVWMIPGAPASRTLRPVVAPPIAMMTFDLAVLIAMFAAHWYWTAFAFALSRGCLALAQARATSKP
jgi:hypothetical protein